VAGQDPVRAAGIVDENDGDRPQNRARLVHRQDPFACLIQCGCADSGHGNQTPPLDRGPPAHRQPAP